MGQTVPATPSAETWLGSCSLSHLLEWSKLYQRRIFLCSTTKLSRTLASRARLVSGKPTIWPMFLDVLSPTAWGFCPDAFRGSSTLVWASQICDISTGDVADAVAVCCNPGCSEGTYAAVPRNHHTATCYTGNTKPSNNLGSLKKGQILFLSILLTHLSRDGKTRVRKQKR